MKIIAFVYYGRYSSQNYWRVQWVHLSWVWGSLFWKFDIFWGWGCSELVPKFWVILSLLVLIKCVLMKKMYALSCNRSILVEIIINKNGLSSFLPCELFPRMGLGSPWSCWGVLNIFWLNKYWLCQIIVFLLSQEVSRRFFLGTKIFYAG